MRHARLRTFLAAAILAAGWAAGSGGGAAMASAGILVDDDHAQCPTAAFSDIQMAINSTPLGGGGTITVCAGTYPGNLVIMNRANLKLIAKGTAIIRPLLPGDTGYGGPLDGAIILAQSSTNVTIQGFNIDGAEGFSPSGDVNGIRFIDSTGTISKNYISRIRRSPMNGDNVGRGIWADGSGLVTAGKLAITSNTITDYQRYGIWVQGNLAPNLSKNLIQTTTAAGSWPTGIEIVHTSGGSVKGNTMRADWQISSFNLAVGMVINDTSNLSASANVSAGNTLGLQVLASCVLGQTVNNKLIGNRIYDATEGIEVRGNASGCGAGADNTQVKSNKIVNTQFWYTPYGGVYLTGAGNTLHTIVSGNAIYGYWSVAVVDGGSGSEIGTNKTADYPPAGPQ